MYMYNSFGVNSLLTPPRPSSRYRSRHGARLNPIAPLSAGWRARLPWQKLPIVSSIGLKGGFA